MGGDEETKAEVLVSWAGGVGGILNGAELKERAGEARRGEREGNGEQLSRGAKGRGGGRGRNLEKMLHLARKDVQKSRRLSGEVLVRSG